MENTVVWFDIPVQDFARAKSFYERVFAVEMTEMAMEEDRMAMFPAEPGAASGALVQSNGYQPSTSGTIVYLNGGSDLATPLGRVAESGGAVLQEKTGISEHGFIAYFQDTEGNRIGLHSLQ